MPFGALERQALGLSLLKASLTELGMACDVRYLTFTFAEFIGYEEYHWMVFEVPYTAVAGDWTFTHVLYGVHHDSAKAYIEEVLCGTWHLDRSAIERILRIRTMAPYFLDYCMAAIPWEEYAIVGFTSTFEQNIASLLLARRIKATYPDIALVFGGANWEAEMGIALQRQFPFVNYVCSGEAERSFSALVQQVLTDKTVECLDTPIPGITYRLETGLVATHTLKPSADEMDALPIPDYSDYFHDLEQSTVAAFVAPILLFETSFAIILIVLAFGLFWCTLVDSTGHLPISAESTGMIADKIISAQVVLRSATGKFPDGNSVNTTETIMDFFPSTEAVARAPEAFATFGFAVGTVQGNSFSISAPVGMF